MEISQTPFFESKPARIVIDEGRTVAAVRTPPACFFNRHAQKSYAYPIQHAGGVRTVWNSKCVNLKHVRKSKQNAPWWLEPGTEVCPACNHTYVIETEYRCVSCDGPLCAMCVETILTEVFCTGCHASAEEPK